MSLTKDEQTNKERTIFGLIYDDYHTEGHIEVARGFFNGIFVLFYLKQWFCCWIYISYKQTNSVNDLLESFGLVFNVINKNIKFSNELKNHFSQKSHLMAYI